MNIEQALELADSYSEKCNAGEEISNEVWALRVLAGAYRRANEKTAWLITFSYSRPVGWGGKTEMLHGRAVHRGTLTDWVLKNPLYSVLSANQISEDDAVKYERQSRI